MSEKPRTEDGSRFAKVFTDDDFLKGIEEALSEATVSSKDVAEKVGCSHRYAKDRLLRLKEMGKIDGEMKGQSWNFKFKK